MIEGILYLLMLFVVVCIAGIAKRTDSLNSKKQNSHRLFRNSTE